MSPDFQTAQLRLEPERTSQVKSVCPHAPPRGFGHVIWTDEILLEALKALAQAAADHLIEMKQYPRIQTRYLREVLPVVGEVHVGTSWPKTHLGLLDTEDSAALRVRVVLSTRSRVEGFRA